MRLALRYTAGARTDIAETLEYYESRSPESGDRFQAEVERVLTVARENPRRYPVYRGRYREAPLVGFRFCIYYRVSAGTLLVVAVYHTSRDPDGWTGRA